MAKKAKETPELQVFEKEGKKYFIDESLVPKETTFKLPCSMEDHTFSSLALDNSIHDLLIRFGIAKELTEESTPAE